MNFLRRVLVLRARRKIVSVDPVRPFITQAPFMIGAGERRSDTSERSLDTILQALDEQAGGRPKRVSVGGGCTA
jgi:hypothetical protein